MDNTSQEKRRLRAEIRRRFRMEGEHSECSRRIGERVRRLPELLLARTVSVYVSKPPEVDTHELIRWAWQEGKRVAVPCCRDGELYLFDLRSMAELTPRTLGILEPHDQLGGVKNRWLAADQIDVFLVPGLAFDRRGGRLGHGKGYYDRLLRRARPGVPRIGMAFSWQVLDAVPMSENDVPMDAIATEQSVHVADVRPT